MENSSEQNRGNGKEAARPPALRNIAWEGFAPSKKADVPEGLWMRCPGCESMVYRKIVEEQLNCCPECGQHYRVSARRRIEITCDPDSFEEFAQEVAPTDPLQFTDRKGYAERLTAEQKKTGQLDAIVVGKSFIKGRAVILAVLDPTFMMGSMGSVVGEKLTRAIERATEEDLPLVVFSTSGGARMQEGAISLAQMAKTSAALARLDDAGGLFISVLCDPTTGGVTASFAMLGDLILAEPKALVGFAGPRTIFQTIRVELPEGFQRAEFLQEKGFVDFIVDRKDMRSEIARIIDYAGK
ncbi:MAG: Acetyl-coenzyme A carboxylase carboxyl transferase subunit beta [Phycisphaerae bacterium]|nr:Acetyl-coenzyme A carboxylase carboxyl transferase subunit beta [Phycisphaerae bacterium]